MISSAGAILSTDIWRQVFTSIGPAERQNVGQLNRTIWSTFENHHFQRGKKRLTRRLVYVHDEESGEEQLLVKETFADQFHVVPFADTLPPPNIIGLDLCIEARPGEKLLKFLAQNKDFLSHSTLQFECIHNFISTVPDGIRGQFMQLFENNYVTAFWGQATNDSYLDDRQLELECRPFKHIAICGMAKMGEFPFPMKFLLATAQSKTFRLLTLDDDWLSTNKINFRRSLLADDPGEWLNYGLRQLFDTRKDVGGKYAVSMQMMHRHNWLKGEQGQEVNNQLGDVLDLRVHQRNGKECLLLRRCPIEDLEKEYMHPDVLFARPKEEKFASRIMVTGIDDPPRPSYFELRNYLPDHPEDATNCKPEMQAYFDLNEKNPGLGLTFFQLPRFYYFDFIQREWIKRERPFNSLSVEFVDN